MNRDQLHKKIDSFNDELINLRRHIHAHPELSGLENQTAILISGFLKNIGWNVRESIGRTGVVADFGPLDKGILGLRVDMDALPIFEETKLSFSSKVDGVMHACGHDLHTSIGLGVAKIVKDLELNFGTRLIFQPAEEIACGARWMIKDGAINGMTHILGVHVYPDLSVGTIGIKEGSLTAAAGELNVEIKGRSGHGARPHEGVDAIWAASKVISGIQESITRTLDPLDPVVITFGKINGGNAFNVLAEKVNLIGTVRCTNRKLFENIGSGKHLSAEEVHEKLVKTSSKVSLATIYRTLRLLVQMGLLHELELSEGGHRYELLSNETPDHHHLICIRCGRTEEFENEEVLEAGKVAAKINGFKLIESSLNVRAICPNCI